MTDRWKLYRMLLIFIVSSVLVVFPSYTYASNLQPPDLGQCHWVGGPYNSYQSLNWAYGGQSWASAEVNQHQFNWSQLRSEVNTARAKNKKIWINLQTAEDTVASKNIPQWALNQGVKTVKGLCGKSPYEISAVWDPKFRQLYTEALRAMKKEFQKDIDDQVITAFVLMSGGNYGESVIGSDLAPWDCYDPDNKCTRTDPNTPCYCKPDVLNEVCPIIQSIASTTSKSPSDIAQKSMCNSTVGEEIKICIQEPCPTEYGSYCYVAEDYFIQSMKEYIDQVVPIFDPLPIVWQWGPGLSGTGRTGRLLQNWFNNKYGSRIWMKFNGWGPTGEIFQTRKFNTYYGNSTRHGYEVGHPMFFSIDYWNLESANYWCSWQNPKPTECTTNPLIPNDVAKRAIATAIKKGLLEDRSSYLCMQSDFFDSAPIDRGGGKMGNAYHFNPNDNTQNCDNSEINASTYGVGFCPGYLNYIMFQVDNPNPPPLIPTVTVTPTPGPQTTTLAFKVSIPRMGVSEVPPDRVKVEVVSSTGSKVNTGSIALVHEGNGIYRTKGSGLSFTLGVSGTYRVYVKLTTSVGRVYNNVVLSTGSTLDCTLENTNCGDLKPSSSLLSGKALLLGDTDTFSYNWINIADFDILVSEFLGRVTTKYTDFNLDGSVDVLDLEVLGLNFNKRGD